MPGYAHVCRHNHKVSDMEDDSSCSGSVVSSLPPSESLLWAHILHQEGNLFLQLPLPFLGFALASPAQQLSLVVLVKHRTVALWFTQLLKGTGQRFLRLLSSTY